MSDYYCPKCDAAYQLSESAKSAEICLFCGNDSFVNGLLEAHQEWADKPRELILPFTIDEATVEKKLTQFIKHNQWFNPIGLRLGLGMKRLRPYFLPIWLTNIYVKAKWKADVSFNESTISAVDKGTRLGWNELEIEKPKFRWETLLGEIDKSFSNLSSMAVQTEAEWLKEQDFFPFRETVSYKPELLGDAILCVPHGLEAENKRDFYYDILSTLQTNIKKAAGAEFIKNFEWDFAESGKPNLTQLLIPMYATHFYDLKGERHLVVINGRTGKLYGKAIRSWFWGVWARLFVVLSGVMILFYLNNLPDNVPLNSGSFPHFVLNCFVLIFMVVFPFIFLFAGYLGMSEHDKFEYRL